MADIKPTVDSYFTLDDEIRESSKQLKVLRDKRKECSEQIVDYLKSNKKDRMTTPRGILLVNNQLKLAKQTD